MSAIAEAYCSSSPTICVRVKSSMMRSAPCPARDGTVSDASPWLRNPLVFRPVSMARSCSIGVVASPTYSSAFAATTSGAFSTAGIARFATGVSSSSSVSGSTWTRASSS